MAILAIAKIDIIEEGEGVRRSSSFHSTPGIFDSGFHVARVFITGGAQLISGSQRRARFIVRQETIGFREAGNGSVYVSVLILISEYRLACGSGIIVNRHTNVAVRRHPINGHGIIRIQGDQLRISISVHVVRISRQLFSVQKGSMTLLHQLGDIKRAIRIDDVRLAYQQQ